jgi:hypothetical protein
VEMSLDQQVAAPQRHPYQRVSKPFRLVVDFTLSLSSMIEAVGYEWVNGNIIPAYFPIDGRGLVEYEACYFGFEEKTLPTKARDWIEEEGACDDWVAAHLAHVLADAASPSVVTHANAIVGLSSIGTIGGTRFLVHSQVGSTKPVLKIEEEALPFMAHTCCLAVRYPRAL